MLSIDMAIYVKYFDWFHYSQGNQTQRVLSVDLNRNFAESEHYVYSSQIKIFFVISNLPISMPFLREKLSVATS